MSKTARFIDVLKSAKIEFRHWSDVFTSTVGLYQGSEYLYQVRNEDEVLRQLIAIGDNNPAETLKNYCEEIYPNSQL